MILVLYIFIAIVILVFALFLMLYLSKIEIDIKNLYMNSRNKKQNNNDILIKISLKIGKLRWIWIKIDKYKVTNIYAIMEKMKNENMEKTIEIENKIKKILQNKDTRELITSIEFNIEKFDAQLSVGIEDPIITSFFVAIGSIIISNIFPHITKKMPKDLQYKVIPLYNQGNMYTLNLNTICNIKIKNIISIIIQLVKTKKLNKTLYKKGKNGTYYLYT